jgi:hypothetical protein
MKKASYLPFFLFTYLFAFTQAPNIVWQRCYGGSGDYGASSVKQTFDGGYILGGSAHSFDSLFNGFHVSYHGSGDLVIVKTNDTGAVEWVKVYGGSGDDGGLGSNVWQCTDSGYIVAVTSISTDGDLTTLSNHGYGDFWVLKLSKTGLIQWTRVLGGAGIEDPSYVQQTKDGGYFVAGYSSSIDGDVIGNHGGLDYWVVKLNAQGGIEWRKSYGGSGEDALFSACQTSDEGYILAGFSNSNNGDVTGHHGDSTSSDFWIVKIDSIGHLQWQRSFGGTARDIARSIQQCKDGGYVVCGGSKSSDGDLTNNQGYTDYWVIKLNNAGNLLWQRSFGGFGDDDAYSITRTLDGGYITNGIAGSFSNGSGDFWVIKIDSGGNKQWEKLMGGSGSDIGYCIQEAKDVGFVALGVTNSNDGVVSGNQSNYAMWLAKLAPDSTDISAGISSSITEAPIRVYPNPALEAITLVSDATIMGEIYTLSDIAGKVVSKDRIAGEFTIVSLYGLSSGVYIIRINGRSYKVIKD